MLLDEQRAAMSHGTTLFRKKHTDTVIGREEPPIPSYTVTHH